MRIRSYNIRVISNIRNNFSYSVHQSIFHHQSQNPMTTRNFYTLFACVCLSLWGLTATAQDDASSSYTYTPKHMWEVGLNAGYVFNAGDIDAEGGFGAGIHARFPLDYVFSIRLGGTYTAFKGARENQQFTTDPRDVKSYEASSLNGSGVVVMSLSNLRWDKSTAEKKTNLYVYGGVGAGLLSGDAVRGDDRENSILRSGEDNAVIGYGIVGGGLAFKISPKFNIGIDHQVNVGVGPESDYMDGYANQLNDQTSYRDILQYSRVMLNFNIGSADEKSEPLYWINPMEGVAKNLEDLNARPVFDLTDTDGDGVIDMIDQEKDTPANAPVDTRGIALDSDGDGVKDYEDQEPYSQPGYSVDGKGVAQTPKYVTQDDVDRSIENALKNYQPIGGGGISDWFLPMIHFNNDSYSIRYTDYGALKNVAEVLKNNPSARVVVKGYTDKTASDSYNTKLSYNRAKSAIEHLVQNYGIARDRLILNYGGEEMTLVPQSGSSLMNRRVEFSIANGENEMAEPAGRAGKGTFGGSRNAGY